MADIFISGGLIYDGSTDGPFTGNVIIEGGLIRDIGQVSCRAAVEIDAKGLAVCPGFIDAHSHSDFTILADPRAEGKLCQGITTEINGNCGMSAAPLIGKAAKRREADLEDLGIMERWSSLDEYFLLLERKGSAVNTAMLAGHGNIRGAIVGYEDRLASGDEIDRMKALLADTLRQGAIGMSTGLIYPPGLYTPPDEISALALTLKGGGLIYTSHMRSEGDLLIEAVHETIGVGRHAGVRVHISHIKTAGSENWHKADAVVALIRQGREEGLAITCDRYPYTASSTDLDSILPAWAYAGGNDEELRRLSSGHDREAMLSYLDRAFNSDYWQRVIIASVISERNRWMEGKTIASICGSAGIGPAELVLDLLLEERLRVGAIFMSMNEANMRKFLDIPWCSIGTDSSARSFDGPTRKGKPHPRGFGSFPRFLGPCVRDGHLMPLSLAIHKSTHLTAATFGLKGRGLLRNGMYADIVVFDPNTISDNATFEDPFRMPTGIQYVFVNGKPAVMEGKPTGVLAGRPLRNGG